MKTAILAALAAGLLLVGTGCSSPCDDMKACCEAYCSEAGLDAATCGCDAYDEAEDDYCEAQRDAIKKAVDDANAAGADLTLPEECDF